jgi:hypothetical protein
MLRSKPQTKPYEPKQYNPSTMRTVSMPSQYFDTVNHKKIQCVFAFKADQVPILQTPDQAKICVNF